MDDERRASRSYRRLRTLLSALSERHLPDEVVGALNAEIDRLNSIAETGPVADRVVRRSFIRIVKVVSRKLNLVPQHYHRAVWIGNGIGVFGIPFGVVGGVVVGSMTFLAISIPLGVSLGMLIGTRMDRRAADEGRQLPVRL
jgi:hypothetical protein